MTYPKEIMSASLLTPNLPRTRNQLIRELNEMLADLDAEPGALSAAVASVIQDHLGGKLMRRNVTFGDGRVATASFSVVLPCGDPVDICGPHLRAPVTLCPPEPVSREETLNVAGDVRGELIRRMSLD